MPTPASRLIPPFIRLLGYKKVWVSASATLKEADDIQLRPEPFGPPRRLRRDAQISVSYDNGWPVYQVAPRGRMPAEYVVYSHGGGWIHQIQPAHWRLIAEVAVGSGSSIAVPIYPLAPLGTAGTVVPAIADLLAALVDRHGADHVTAMGDSSGGQITLSAVLLMRQRGVPPLHHTVIVSPVLDASFSNPGIDQVEPRDPWLGRPGLRAAADLWRADLPIEDLLVSPLFADPSALGPLTIFSGTRDITNPDIRSFVSKAREAGVEVCYYEAVDLVHVYPLLPIPEGRQARQAIIETLRD
jgi:acetyl esterase/lipase